jgi:hypothetical protein
MPDKPESALMYDLVKRTQESGSGQEAANRTKGGKDERDGAATQP